MVLLQNPENSNFLLEVHFRHRYQSDPDFSEMNNDADFIFIVVWQHMIGVSNMANLFDLNGGQLIYVDFKKWSKF